MKFIRLSPVILLYLILGISFLHAQEVKNNLSNIKEIGRDGNFVAYDNGTVLDRRTGLMWAAMDNGVDISWKDAKAYCENFRGGGYKDWRMPTIDELDKLYKTGNGYSQKCCNTCDQLRITRLITLTCSCSWTSEISGNRAANFLFYSGSQVWSPQYLSSYYRVLPVRNTN